MRKIQKTTTYRNCSLAKPSFIAVEGDRDMRKHCPTLPSFGRLCGHRFRVERGSDF
ncbi:hypothetical protein HanPSC8_Chr12g0539071 [Helianthus annuus]|nr:hypothetical protein HanPSC8_Chr12g0539071 [Helianthus annuus]